jgi:hypothetical protein
MTHGHSGSLSIAACLLTGVTGVAAAQAPATAPGLTSRKTTAMTYEARRDTKVDLVGTPLMPRARRFDLIGLYNQRLANRVGQHLALGSGFEPPPTP